MPNNSSYADFIVDCDKLVLAADENRDLLPSAEPHLQRMRETVDQVKVFKTRQGSHQASRQLSTQELGKLITQGREEAIRLRGAIKADLGPKSELLVRFGITPQRRRIRRPKDEKPTPTDPPTGTTPEEETVTPKT